MALSRGFLLSGLDLECAERAVGKIFYREAKLTVVRNVPMGRVKPSPFISVVELATFLGVGSRVVTRALRRLGFAPRYPEPEEATVQRRGPQILSPFEAEEVMRAVRSRLGARTIS